MDQIKKIIGIAVVISVLLSFTVKAEEKDNKWNHSIGTVYLNLPSYAGSKKRKDLIFPYFSTNYKKKYYLDAYNGLTLKKKLKSLYINKTHLFDIHIDYGASIAFGRDESIPALNGWGKIDTAIKTVLKHKLKKKYAFIDANYSYYLFDQNKAQEIELGIGHGIYIPFVKIFGAISIQTIWANQHYMNLFYGTENQIETTNIKRVHLSSGIKQNAFILVLIKPITNKLTIITPMSFAKLSNQVIKSPLIATKYQQSFIIILSYKLGQ